MLNIFVYIQQFIGICFQEDNTETVPEVPQEEEAVEETPCEVSYLMSERVSVRVSACMSVSAGEGTITKWQVMDNLVVL